MDAEALFAEGVEDVFGHVGQRIGMERAVGAGGLIIGRLRIEHAKPVMVFRSESDIAHTAQLRGLHPRLWIEMLRIEGAVQRPVVAPETLQVSPALFPTC